ncbi:MAG: methionine adenosyltransferase [Candidatus Odinarchaeota archaeon]|nr:methionine adenosyltransferase [Candidatus Odinarchaeota archaeon]
MMDFVDITQLTDVPVSKRDIEIVERKGIGHPDTICDAIVDEVSRRLSKYYIEQFGTILHHNVDKAVLVGGSVQVDFGGGDVLDPIYILVVGRVTNRVRLEDGGEVEVPVGPIILSAIRDYIKRNFRFLDPDLHIMPDYKVRSGSQDLRAIFNAKSEAPLANDTSVGVSFAPLSPLEKLVLETETLLNSKDVKKEIPEIGEDIKVMGLRRGNTVNLTIAVATIASLIPNLDHYLDVKDRIIEKVKDLSAKLVPEYEVKIFVNTADIVDPENPSVYLTVTGTSSEAGDDGQVGRGNRVNGLITPFRPMTLEATAGKNPVNHVGKIYTVLANRIANQIIEKVEYVDEAYVEILSQIGKPITQPQVVSVSIRVNSPEKWNVIKSEISSLVESEVANATKLTNELVEGKIRLF